MDAHILGATGTDIRVSDDRFEAATRLVLDLEDSRAAPSNEEERSAVKLGLELQPRIVGLLQIRRPSHFVIFIYGY